MVSQEKLMQFLKLDIGLLLLFIGVYAIVTWKENIMILITALIGPLASIGGIYLAVTAGMELKDSMKIKENVKDPEIGEGVQYF